MSEQRGADFLSATPEEIRTLLLLVEDMPQSYVRWILRWVKQGLPARSRPREIIVSMEAMATIVREEREETR